jgi:hypothetical protein
MQAVPIHVWLAAGQHFLISGAPYIAAAALLLVFLLLINVALLERRISRLTLGRNGSLEETLGILSRDMKDMREFKGEVERYLKLVENRLRGSISGVGLVRFNPFSADGQGGNQSFAVALLDEEANGVVLSTLYARNHVGVYAKPLQNGTSTYELSQEEKEAIERARQNSLRHKKK